MTLQNCAWRIQTRRTLRDAVQEMVQPRLTPLRAARPVSLSLGGTITSTGNEGITSEPPLGLCRGVGIALLEEATVADIESSVITLSLASPTCC